MRFVLFSATFRVPYMCFDVVYVNVIAYIALDVSVTHSIFRIMNGKRMPTDMYIFGAIQRCFLFGRCCWCCIFNKDIQQINVFASACLHVVFVCK